MIDLFHPPTVQPTGARRVLLSDMNAPVEHEKRKRTRSEATKRKRRRKTIALQVERLRTEIAWRREKIEALEIEARELEES